MVIQVDADVDGLAGQPVNFAAYFYLPTGEQLIGNPFAAPDAYKAVDGQVTTQRFESPLYVATKFTKVELFIPYTKLTTTRLPGRLELMYRVEIQHNDGKSNRRLTQSLNQKFFITQ